MAEELVLVVDDEAPIATLLAYLVRGCGFLAEVAHDGQQALESIRAHRPDLVLLDLLMPIMSGSELLAIMETDPDLRGVPVVVISTSNGAIEGVEREVPRLPKPFEPADVKRLLRETLTGDGHAAAASQGT
jgi:CheY-like chemotaxis protein